MVFTVVHASHRRDNENQILECILMHVEKCTEEEGEDEGQGSAFSTQLEWLTFTSGMSTQWPTHIMHISWNNTGIPVYK